MSSNPAPPASSATAHPLIDRAQVGARLRAVRKSQKLTLKQLSERSGQTIQVWLWLSHSAGMRKPSARGVVVRVVINSPKH